ncbi:RNA ligase [Haloarchaeobius sp. DFWS5]|uniref:RNA ligase n=1 Tax=Haloarchaeobius sp. DFWS5 TaxID=3446114 RepID=UPI003EB9D990
MEYVDGLGLSRRDFEAVADRFGRREFRGREYYNLRQRTRKLPSGTAVVGDVVVRGFPSIQRLLVLDAGIRRVFDGPFVAEEKLNGYNVRVVRLRDGAVLGFTRSGVICPFTTEVVRRDLDLGEFFDRYPDAMLCGEMVGPENPYTTCAYPEADSIAFFAFDVRHRETGAPFPPGTRRRVCKRFAIPQVRHFGTFAPSESSAIHEAVNDLDRARREGIVLKSADGNTLAKYTTSACNRGNLRYGFAYPVDYGKEYVYPRLLREAFRAVELGDTEEKLAERSRKVGEDILGPFVEAIRDVAAGETLSESHTVRGDPRVLDELLDHLGSLGLHVRIESDRTRDGERVLTFSKHYRSSTDSLSGYLDGGTLSE